MELVPTKPKLWNSTYRGYKTNNPAVLNGTVKDLNVLNDGSSIYSVWKLESVWDRIKFIFHGKITCRTLGQRVVPTILLAGDETRGKRS